MNDITQSKNVGELESNDFAGQLLEKFDIEEGL